MAERESEDERQTDRQEERKRMTHIEQVTVNTTTWLGRLCISVRSVFSAPLCILSYTTEATTGRVTWSSAQKSLMFQRVSCAACLHGSESGIRRTDNKCDFSPQTQGQSVI